MCRTSTVSGVPAPRQGSDATRVAYVATRYRRPLGRPGEFQQASLTPHRHPDAAARTGAIRALGLHQRGSSGSSQRKQKWDFTGGQLERQGMVFSAQKLACARPRVSRHRHENRPPDRACRCPDRHCLRGRHAPHVRFPETTNGLCQPYGRRSILRSATCATAAPRTLSPSGLPLRPTRCPRYASPPIPTLLASNAERLLADRSYRIEPASGLSGGLSRRRRGRRAALALENVLARPRIPSALIATP